jgi:hypothetical protein
MYRTTIMLPETLKTRALEAAREDGISLGEIIRRALEDRLAHAQTDLGRDPFFSDTRVDDSPGAEDGAARHDDYLYGDEP